MYPTVYELAEKEALIRPAHILVATDLDDLDRLTPHMVAQAKACGSEVTLVHVLPPRECLGLDSAVCGQSCKKVELQAEQMLRAKAEELEAQGISCSYAVSRGLASYALMEKIKVTGATRLMMASHGRGKLGQFLMGSVANQMLGFCPIPVFMVPPHCKTDSSFCEPKRILHPVSLHDDYQATAEIAMKMADAYGAALSFLHIVPERHSAGIPSPLSWGKELLAELGSKRTRLEPSIVTTSIYGDPVDEIVREAARWDADWIVMGVKDDYQMFPLGESLAYRVMAKARCPVMAVSHHAALSKAEAEQAAALVVAY